MATENYKELQKIAKDNPEIFEKELMQLFGEFIKEKIIKRVDIEEKRAQQQERKREWDRQYQKTSEKSKEYRREYYKKYYQKKKLEKQNNLVIEKNEKDK